MILHICHTVSLKTLTRLIYPQSINGTLCLLIETTFDLFCSELFGGSNVVGTDSRNEPEPSVAADSSFGATVSVEGGIQAK